VRFVAITPIHVKVICSGKVIEILQVEEERRARLELSARTDAGVQTLLGEAVISLSQRDGDIFGHRVIERLDLPCLSAAPMRVEVNRFRHRERGPALGGLASEAALRSCQ